MGSGDGPVLRWPYTALAASAASVIIMSIGAYGRLFGVPRYYPMAWNIGAVFGFISVLIMIAIRVYLSSQGVGHILRSGRHKIILRRVALALVVVAGIGFAASIISSRAIGVVKDWPVFVDRKHYYIWDGSDPVAVSRWMYTGTAVGVSVAFLFGVAGFNAIAAEYLLYGGD